MTYGWSLWRRDQELTRQLFLDGCAYRAQGSEYLGNDFLFESLRELGFWDQLTSPEPTLGRTDVAVRPDVLNALWVVKELAGMGHVSEAEKLLSDGYLMAECGFNVETIRERAIEGNAPVVSLRTVYRHAKRMARAESERMVLNTTVMLREKKWLRGGLYAADCFEIPVSGKKMEGSDENTDKKTRLGYKLLTIANVREDREFIVTAAVGGICQDERVLLMRALKALRTVVEPREIIRLLLLDRGFWKAQLLWELANEWKIPFLTIAKSDLDLTREVRRLGGDPERHPDPPNPQMETSSRRCSGASRSRAKSRGSTSTSPSPTPSPGGCVTTAPVRSRRSSLTATPGAATAPARSTASSPSRTQCLEIPRSPLSSSPPCPWPGMRGPSSRATASASASRTLA